MLPSPINQISNPRIQTIIFLSVLNFYYIQSVNGSNNEIDELNAAIDKRTKNKTEKIFPKGKE